MVFCPLQCLEVAISVRSPVAESACVTRLRGLVGGAERVHPRGPVALHAQFNWGLLQRWDGPIMGHFGWGGPSTGLTLLFLQQWCLGVGVSRCGPAAVVGRGCWVFRRGKLIIIIIDSDA